jgi:hypothetical protein
MLDFKKSFFGRFTRQIFKPNIVIEGVCGDYVCVAPITRSKILLDETLRAGGL